MHETVFGDLNKLKNSRDIRTYVEKLSLEGNPAIINAVKTKLMDSLRAKGFIEGVHGYTLLRLLGTDLIGKSLEVELNEVSKLFTSSSNYEYLGNTYKIICDGSSDERAVLTYEITEDNIDEFMLELSLLLDEGAEISVEAEAECEMLEYEIYANSCQIFDVSGNELTDKKLISNIWNSVDDLYDHAEYSDEIINYSIPRFYIDI